MKKLLCIALCAVMVLSAFAGCTPQEQPESTPVPTTKHTHSFERTWSSNETSHWKACSGCQLQASLGAHIDDDLDGKCNDCGYEEACEHTFDTEKWITDAENHWHPATCKHEGMKGDLAAHADENNDGVCDVCAYFDPEHEHSYQEEWTTDANEHWHDANCGHDLVNDKAAHVDAENDGVCDVCKWADETHTHTFEEGWSVDAGNHWHAATCEHTGAVDGLTRHADEDVNGYCDTCEYLMCTHSDFDVDGVCDICGYEDPDHTHTYATEWASNHLGHWQIAQCHPGATTKVESHGDKNNDGTCDTCAFVICSHTYKKSWSSDETHHWYQLTCTCSVVTRKDYAEHVDADGINGCDVCMHGYQAPSPIEVIIDKQKVTYVPTGMITYQEVTITIPKAGRYLVTSDNTAIRWYESQTQENKPTSYASEIYFEQAGEVTLLAYYFTFDYATATPFDIHLTVTCIDDLVLNTQRGKAELPTNMTYKVVFEAMELGTWTLHTSVANVSMGTTEQNMQLATSVDVTVEKAGDLVELYVYMEDEVNNTFIFDWELAEPFQLDVSLGMSPVSVPAEGDDYKVVFTAPEDGRFLLNVTSDYLSFSEWGLGGFSAPVRIESTQQLTPEMKKGETFTTWLQTVYDYPLTTNVNDTLTVINVGTMLRLGSATTVTEDSVDQFGAASTYTATENGIVTITLENGYFGVADESGNVTNLGTEIIQEMKTGESIVYYVYSSNDTDPVKRTITFLRKCAATAEGSIFSFTAKESTYYQISVVDGEIGITNNGVTQWVNAKEVDGKMISTFEVKVHEGDTYVFQIRSESGVTIAEINAVEYVINMGDMYDSTAETKEEMGKELSVNMIPSKEYDIMIPDAMLNMKVKLNWDYKGVTVYVGGEIYKMGDEINLYEAGSIAARLQNNVAVDVKFTLTVVYVPEKVEAVTSGELVLNADMNYLAVAGGKAEATFTAEIGGTFTLNCFTEGAVIYVQDAMGQLSAAVISGIGTYTFQLDAGETITFIIQGANGEQVTAQLVLSQGSGK